MHFDTWLFYLLTCCGISVVPGPNALLVLTHGALHGNRKTLFTITGGVIGFIAMIALCVLGLGALLKASMLWLTVLKVVGGLYLIWLGVNIWRSEPVTLSLGDLSNSSRWLRIPRHSDTQPTNIRTLVPRSFGPAVGAQRRRFALLV